MLTLLKSGTTHGKQIPASLQGHFLGKGHLVLVTSLHRFDIRPLEHGIGSRQIRSLFILDRISKDRALDRRRKTDLLFDGELFTL